MIRDTAVLLLGCSLLLAFPVVAEWPLIWDNEQRGDVPVAAQRGPDGDLYILVESYLQGSVAPHAVLLRLDPNGAIRWIGLDLDLHVPLGLAIAPSGDALVVGRGVDSGSGLHASSFAATDGALQWTQVRTDVEWTFPAFGGHAQPAWDPGSAAWRIPLRKAGGFAVVGFESAGTPIADQLWALPTGTGGASAVKPRPDGGWYVAGTFDGGPEPPGWWTVALDATGAELWSFFDAGAAPAGILSAAHLLEGAADELIGWAEDETACGVFSLHMWSLDPANGSERWTTTWPPPGDCSSFDPDNVARSGERILASGVDSSFSTSTVSFEAATGGLVWERGFGDASTSLASAVTGAGGAALVATSLFPVPNPGPIPLWLGAWDRSGIECAAAQALLPARVTTATLDGLGNWLVVGWHHHDPTAADLVVQRLDDPCAGLLADDFETGDLSRWSTAILAGRRVGRLDAILRDGSLSGLSRGWSSTVPRL